jgi:hypothetical protein
MATWAASAGSEEGFEAFDDFSRKSKKHDKEETRRRWEHYPSSPPTMIGAGSLFYWADQASPSWKKKPVIIKATAFQWIDAKDIPPRDWLYFPYYTREYLMASVASGGMGKSTLLIGESLAMVSGKPLIGTYPVSALRVWYWNGEDPKNELDRRFAAAIKHHQLTSADIGDRLFVDSGRTIPIVIAETQRGDVKICDPVVDQVIKTLKDNRIDVLIIDPSISCRRVPESDNDAIELVAKKWAHIAEETKCNIHVAQHTRKLLNGIASTEDSRGAKALTDAARAVRVINSMSNKNAEDLGIPEDERQLYLRTDSAKANLAPASAAHWYKLASVNLGNRAIQLPGVPMRGDEVGVATAWQYPDKTATTPEQRQKALELIKQGDSWRFDSQATTWIGKPIAEALGYDLQIKINKKSVDALIDEWLNSGILEKYQAHDSRRRPREHVRVAAKKKPR